MNVEPYAPGGSGWARTDAVAGATAEELTESLRELTDPALGRLLLEDMLKELLERIRARLAVDTATVLLLDSERGVLVARASRGIEQEVREGVQLPLGRGFAGRVASEARPIVIESLERAEIVNPLLRERGICSLLGVPLLVEGRVIGVLHVGSVTPRVFDAGDVGLLQLAADRVALAIDKAQLSEHRTVTEIMQRTLLPMRLPEVPGLRFSAKYLPAGEGPKIGGDWYDVFHLSDGRVAFVIGDVSGRGAVAASVMAEARTALRAYALEGHDVDTVMTLLNELLSSIRRDRSATAALFALELERQELTMVSAGHLPAVLLSPDGEQRFISEAIGPPLGAVTGHEYTAQRVSFPTGSTLLLYTDGLIERRDEPIDVGLQRLLEISRGALQGQERTFAERIYKRAASDGPLRDDVALLAIESLPHEPRMRFSVEATTRNLAGLRRAIASWLTRLEISERERFDIVLACSEAAGNAIEHAYGPGESTFSVDCEWAGGEVRIRVADTGAWRPQRRDERGRGLMLMREFMDSVNVERGQHGTVVTLVKRVSVQR
ncbi:MAG: hypothetical protein QOI03_1900 [Solirubrobacteraceae bacterium]|nr:hypothetical protein [Solirubrobacteraceae bacterium]